MAFVRSFSAVKDDLISGTSSFLGIVAHHAQLNFCILTFGGANSLEFFSCIFTILLHMYMSCFSKHSAHVVASSMCYFQFFYIELKSRSTTNKYSFEKCTFS